MHGDMAELEAKSHGLRRELKVWEKQFATANDGRKASRDDIKANADIASKYKEYNKLRDILSGKRTLESPAQPSKKRRSITEHTETPSKRSRTPAATPSKKEATKQIEVYEFPSSGRKLFTPAHQRAFVGPTPQKDGQVLGLFDLMPTETPSKGQRQPLHEINANIACTPQKVDKNEDLLETGHRRLTRTPTSSGKRFLLDCFATPMKRKLVEEGTPSSAVKHLKTPTFLRRDSQFMPILAEEHPSPEARAPWKRRSFGRSLSGMIRDMKKQEEEKLDEDLELLREMEQDAGESKGSKKKSIPMVEVEDSQAQHVTLDADGFVPSDAESGTDQEDELGESRQPKRIWKKKGQKRQTKRVIMRPVRNKPKAQAEEPISDDESNGEAVSETQKQCADMSDDDVSDFEAGGEDELAEEESQPKKRQPDSKQAAKHKQSHVLQEKNIAAKNAQKKPRKVNPEAHANYRKLKIKNKNSKANGRKWGRGRR